MFVREDLSNLLKLKYDLIREKYIIVWENAFYLIGNLIYQLISEKIHKVILFTSLILFKEFGDLRRTLGEAY